MESSEIKVYFSINYNTIYGENVYLVGDIPLLGNWDPKKGFPLAYHHVHHILISVKLSRVENGLEC